MFLACQRENDSALLEARRRPNRELASEVDQNVPLAVLTEKYGASSTSIWKWGRYRGLDAPGWFDFAPWSCAFNSSLATLESHRCR